MAGSNDIMAQAVFLAQLEASKSKCECRACKVLRKATEMMTDQFLKAEEQPQRTPVISKELATALTAGEEGS